LPKSGTNLLASIMRRMPGYEFQQLLLNRRLYWHPVNFAFGWRGPYCYAGINQPKPVSLRTLDFQITRLRSGHYTSAHLDCGDAIHQLSIACVIAVVFVCRDPRDVLVSNLHHTLLRARHFLHKKLRDMPDDRRRLEALIRGFPARGGRVA